MKLIVSMIQEIFKMLNLYAVDIPTSPVNLCLSHLIQFLVECLAVQKECRAAEIGRQAFGTHMVYRETSSTALYPLELNPWSSGISEPIHSSTAEKNENQTPVQNQRCQSGPSATDLVIPVRETPQRIVEQTKKDCRFQICISTNSPHQQRLLVGRFKTDVCTCSQFPTEVMLWIKEVEMVD